MTTTTENFTRNGRHYATLTEENNGVTIIQRWRYAPDARSHAGAPLGAREANVCLTAAAQESGDFEALIAAHAALCGEPDMTDAGCGDVEFYREEFARSAYITLHANNHFISA